MTNSEAKEILENQFMKLVGNNLYQNPTKIDMEEALFVAYKALEEPQPLTLEQLGEMKDKPIYITEICKTTGEWGGYWEIFKCIPKGFCQEIKEITLSNGTVYGKCLGLNLELSRQICKSLFDYLTI